MKTTIGFIGLGMMGEPMAMRILQAGFPLAVHNRTKGKAKKLIESGALWHDSPRSVAEKSEIVFTMVSNSGALEEISLPSDGILEGFTKGGIHIDTSTVSPVTTQRLAQEYTARGASFLHAPVLGSIPQATEGTLLLFVGGAEPAFKRSQPVLKLLGSRIWRFEKVEQATHIKLLCNFFIGTMISTLTQALVFAKKASVNPRTLIEVIGNSALHAPMYQTKGVAIIERNFKPRFYLEHMLKDINLLVDAAGSLGVSMPSAETAQALFLHAQSAGFGREDYSSVVKILERIADVEVS